MKFRVFLSYSHEDHALAQGIAKRLEQRDDLILQWDQNLRPGERFTDAIKGMIGCSHVFMPLLTSHSQKRPWVHQETGYAIALDIPVLPLAYKDSLKESILTELQAIVFHKEDGGDLPSLLANMDLKRLVRPAGRFPREIFREAYWPEERTELLANYTNMALKNSTSDEPECLRQAGALTSFCLPDADLKDSVWRLRDGLQKRSEYLHHLQREERRALEKYARAHGCRLILYPEQTFSRRGRNEAEARAVRHTRLKTLMEFLKSMDDEKVEVAIRERSGGGNLTIVGDWFAAESLLPGPEGYRQTLFKWHAPTVFQQIEEFDRTFKFLPRCSVEQVVDCLEKIISKLAKQGLSSDAGRGQKFTKRGIS